MSLPERPAMHELLRAGFGTSRDSACSRLLLLYQQGVLSEEEERSIHSQVDQLTGRVFELPSQRQPQVHPVPRQHGHGTAPRAMRAQARS